ncbi:hypothetical protein BKA69DRAFT_547087 [Paraphysoderma sedebokerense]|nr:hypothetical protein BKA69DRAFT_547087 [Paraphysoderma sedebokerense]
MIQVNEQQLFPVELCDAIFEFVGAKTLHNLSLLNRQWYNAVQSFLQRKWIYFIRKYRSRSIESNLKADVSNVLSPATIQTFFSEGKFRGMKRKEFQLFLDLFMYYGYWNGESHDKNVVKIRLPSHPAKNPPSSIAATSDSDSDSDAYIIAKSRKFGSGSSTYTISSTDRQFIRLIRHLSITHSEMLIYDTIMTRMRSGQIGFSKLFHTVIRKLTIEHLNKLEMMEVNEQTRSDEENGQDTQSASESGSNQTESLSAFAEAYNGGQNNEELKLEMKKMKILKSVKVLLRVCQMIAKQLWKIDIALKPKPKSTRSEGLRCLRRELGKVSKTVDRMMDRLTFLSES